MPITITDPKLIEQLKAAGDEVVFTDANGVEIARFTHEYPFAPPIELMDRCMTEEQLAASRASGPGRPFDEVMEDLRAGRPCMK